MTGALPFIVSFSLLGLAIAYPIAMLGDRVMAVFRSEA